jgi:glycosyltransferase involved in cell wall biosynthesis
MTNPVSVLHVLNECVDGSISRIVERIIGCSPAGQFEWHVCSVNGQNGFEKNLEKLDAKVIDFSFNDGKSLYPWQRINRYIQENNIRIVHSHTPRTILEVWKALNLSTHNQKGIVHHLATKHLLTRPGDRKWGLAYTLYDHLTLYIPDHIVTVSKTMAGEVKAQPWINPSKVTAIPNAIPVSDFYRPQDRESIRRQLKFDDSIMAIGYTGRIEKVKNLGLLIDAFLSVYRQYPNTRLVIIGEGSLRSYLEEYSEKLGISGAILWTGFCSNIPLMLSALDIYVLPSINEGLSLSILEAMAAEKPVVATRVGSAIEVIKHGKTGILINPGSKEEIINAILDLLENVEYRDNLAKQARQFVTSDYDIQTMVDGYCDIYMKMGTMG